MPIVCLCKDCERVIWTRPSKDKNDEVRWDYCPKHKSDLNFRTSQKGESALQKPEGDANLAREIALLAKDLFNSIRGKLKNKETIENEGDWKNLSELQDEWRVDDPK